MSLEHEVQKRELSKVLGKKIKEAEICTDITDEPSSDMLLITFEDGSILKVKTDSGSPEFGYSLSAEAEVKSYQIPDGYEEDPNAVDPQTSLYRCAKCKTVFVAAHFRIVRTATGRTVEHCGEPAWWITNLRRKETTPEEAQSAVEDANSELSI